MAYKLKHTECRSEWLDNFSIKIETIEGIVDKAFCKQRCQDHSALFFSLESDGSQYLLDVDGARINPGEKVRFYREKFVCLKGTYKEPSFGSPFALEILNSDGSVCFTYLGNVADEHGTME